MKSYKYLLFVAAMAANLVAQDATSQTFFSVRPQFQPGSPEYVSIVHGERGRWPESARTALSITFFGGKSTNGCALGSYFFPFNKSTIIAGEFGSSAAANRTVDVFANYFGVLTANPFTADGTGPIPPTGPLFSKDNLTYQSRLTIAPQQSVVGFGVNWRQRVAGNEEHALWLGLSFPIVRVKNNLNFSEQIINPGGGKVPAGYVGTMTAALRGDTVFGNKKFCFGKMDCVARSLWGVADLQLRLGVERIYLYGFLDWYVGAVIPTGNRPTAEFVFEPIVGNNKHGGLTTGGTHIYQLWDTGNDNTFWLETHSHFQYLFTNTQRRSFDLVDKQWGRYLWVYPNNTGQAFVDIQPGINTFTRDMRVSPRMSATINAALCYAGKRFKADVGYNFYARQAEKVCLACCWQPGPGIAGININDADVIYSESAATMYRFLNAEQGVTFDDLTMPGFVTVQDRDLDLRSAAHPAILSNTIYGTVGVQWLWRNCPFTAGIGASYEFADVNTVLRRWLGWVTLSVII